MAYDLSKLGVKRNVPKVNFTDYTGVIVGYPKWGKTTIASMFPKAIIIPFERGYKAQVVNVLEGMDSWDSFIEFIDNLEADRAEIGDEIQTLVFDTVNEAYDLCLEYMLKTESRKAKTKYTAIGDLPYGQGYAKLDEYFKEQIDRIVNLGFTILFISHSKVKTIKPKEGESYDIYTSTMSDRLEKIVYPLVDYIIFGEQAKVIDPLTQVSTMKRVMKVSGASSDSNAGSRLALKQDIVFDNEEEAVAKFQEYFSQAIAEKLRKAGIKDDVKSLSKKQAKEKQENVEKYIADKKKVSPDEIVAEIKQKIGTATDEQKKAFMSIMSANGVTSLENPDQIDAEVLTSLLKALS